MRFQEGGYAKDNTTLQKWETLEGWQEVRGYDFDSWLGLLAPVATPRDIV